jgi:hypothetical protein
MQNDIPTNHITSQTQVVVSVARKTDESEWPLLFAVAGPPASLFEECFVRRRLRAAANYILVIDRVEGTEVSNRTALRLLQVRHGGFVPRPVSPASSCLLPPAAQFHPTEHHISLSHLLLQSKPFPRHSFLAPLGGQEALGVQKSSLSRPQINVHH